MISKMTLSNQSHFPRFFSTPESHLVGFCRSYKMTLAIGKKEPLCFLIMWCHSISLALCLLWALPIPAYDKPESARPGKSSPVICWRRKMTYRGLADSGFFSPRKMTYRNLANSDLRQAGIGQAQVSHLPELGGAGKSSCQISKDGLMRPAA